MFFIALFSSYGVALLLSLAFEVPVMHLDKILFNGGGGKRRRPLRQVNTHLNGDEKAPVEDTRKGEEIEENGVRLVEQREPLVNKE
jgi:hypothetical protein